MKEHKFLKKVAETAVSYNVNSACMCWFHQAAVPVACKKFKKVK